MQDTSPYQHFAKLTHVDMRPIPTHYPAPFFDPHKNAALFTKRKRYRASLFFSLWFINIIHTSPFFFYISKQNINKSESTPKYTENIQNKLPN